MAPVSPRFKRLLIAVITLLGLFAVYQTFDVSSTSRSVKTPNTYIPDTPVGQNVTSSGNNLRAALVALVRNSELNGMRSTVRQLEDRFNNRHNYPYIFLNDEDFTEEFKDGMRSVTKAPVYFGKLPTEHWGLSPYVTEKKVQEALEHNRDRYLYGGSYSYRLMCRYQSGFVYKHDLLKDLDYYWRIEPDVNYYCDIPYDPFKYMKDNKLIYGFTISPVEKAETVETLWETTRKWILENPDYLQDKSFIHWVVNEKSVYTRCHFWSNFEIVDLSFYRSEAYESYFQHLDRAGGFFYERWGDAPVHSMAASILLRKEQIHWFEDIGYHHPGYAHCPDKPEMAARCVCGGGSDYMYRSMCNRRFGEVGNIHKDQVLELAAMPDKQ
ncbi:alpha-1,2-mannosyltransferase ktr1 [Coemansia sp. RSA 353]|nr:alpha-1,2-mannosyltransferase ktr1 [Coemansia sp. RSA 564]KAJ2170068.1 alpha-1,2-mannosyltransferase ktr1 [Coemansia sp. RSA 560]KAJ2189360.1 alpha-1,2-mannosyltransferase ktr1 [Coemansia sp. RSA 522]KAJ2199088.1 alpha-1,2-mannosyltransferase ktr1 [Coemansia sp. RSA 521]KAJ2218500.1 alpha-1,2-mannosyltransferase ktr1 [Coemansia sp. RSA 518]KAJ2266345.1 alpha-1,2-mannosyltransferase ktr1 [Coemansia sp. RSA 371]KAJ2269321.1 alpha-1,2-mannosyltransferase ktr1 [Coemansia sp. RSA 370]KAJ228536